MDLLLPALVVGDVQASHVTHQNSPSLGLLADEAVNGLPDVGVVSQQLVEKSVEGIQHIVGALQRNYLLLSGHQLELVPQVVFEERRLPSGNRRLFLCGNY